MKLLNLLLLFVSFFILLQITLSKAEKKPNIIFALADDLGTKYINKIYVYQVFKIEILYNINKYFTTSSLSNSGYKNYIKIG